MGGAATAAQMASTMQTQEKEKQEGKQQQQEKQKKIQEKQEEKQNDDVNLVLAASTMGTVGYVIGTPIGMFIYRILGWSNRNETIAI